MSTGCWGLRGWGFMKHDIQRRTRAGRNTRGMAEGQRPSHAVDMPVLRADTSGLPEPVYPLQRQKTKGE